MSAVNVTNVTVLDNPSMFQNPFQFEISYECLVPLKDGESSLRVRSENVWHSCVVVVSKFLEPGYKLCNGCLSLVVQISNGS